MYLCSHKQMCTAYGYQIPYSFFFSSFAVVNKYKQYAHFSLFIAVLSRQATTTPAMRTYGYGILFWIMVSDWRTKNVHNNRAQHSVESRAWSIITRACVADIFYKMPFCSYKTTDKDDMQNFKSSRFYLGKRLFAICLMVGACSLLPRSVCMGEEVCWLLIFSSAIKIKYLHVYPFYIFTSMLSQPFDIYVLAADWASHIFAKF